MGFGCKARERREIGGGHPAKERKTVSQKGRREERELRGGGAERSRGSTEAA